MRLAEPADWNTAWDWIHVEVGARAETVGIQTGKMGLFRRKRLRGTHE
jgi:hypothetical protein